MRIAVTGSEKWAEYLARTLGARDIDARFVHRKSLSELFEMLQWRPDVILIPGMAGSLTIRRLALWFVLGIGRLLTGSKVIVYWIGSDVSTLSPNGAWRAIFRLIGAKHICGAPWFVQELHAKGIEAVSTIFPYDTSRASEHAHRTLAPKPYRVLLYLSVGGWENVHGDEMLELAKSLPEIGFSVIGISHNEIPGQKVPPANVSLLGWVGDPCEILADHHAFLRWIDHDAYSGMVRDGLAMGKTVLYSLPVNSVVYAETFEQFRSALAQLSQGQAVEVLTNGYDLPPYDQQVEGLVQQLTG
jgi:hypothetical protein